MEEEMTSRDLADQMRQELTERVLTVEQQLSRYEQYHWELSRQLKLLEAELEQLLQSLSRMLEADRLYSDCD
jgi:hypothetical protein